MMHVNQYDGLTIAVSEPSSSRVSPSEPFSATRHERPRARAGESSPLGSHVSGAFRLLWLTLLEWEKCAPTADHSGFDEHVSVAAAPQLNAQ